MQITHSPFAIATNMHGAFTKQSLRSVGIPATVSITLFEGPQLPKILYKIVQSLKFSKDCKIVMKDCNLA